MHNNYLNLFTKEEEAKTKANTSDKNYSIKMDSIKCPKMQEFVARADADMNGCITKEEFHAAKPEMPKHHGPKGMPAPEGMPMPEAMDM